MEKNTNYFNSTCLSETAVHDLSLSQVDFYQNSTKGKPSSIILLSQSCIKQQETLNVRAQTNAADLESTTT